MKLGDIVLYVDGRHRKNRPALVLQNDHDNQRLTNTIVAMISGNVRHAAEPTQFFIDPATAEGVLSGLHGASVVKCTSLFTVAQEDIIRVIGHLSDDLLTQVEECLKAALDLS